MIFFLKSRLDYVMVNDISTLLLTAKSLSNTVKGAVSAQEVMQHVALVSNLTSPLSKV